MGGGPRYVERDVASHHYSRDPATAFTECRASKGTRPSKRAVGRHDDVLTGLVRDFDDIMKLLPTK